MFNKIQMVYFELMRIRLGTRRGEHDGIFLQQFVDDD